MQQQYNWRRGVSILLVALSLLAFGRGGWIWAKAHLANYLIEGAWQHTLATGEQAKPWRWADTWPVARLQLGEESHLVLQGVSGQAMAFGPGLMDNSEPVLQTNNVIIAGHRDTHFAGLRHTKIGDVIGLETPRGTRHFRVAQRSVVEETAGYILEQGGPQRLTLITCYPFDGLSGQATQRWVVTAYPIDPSSIDRQTVFTWPDTASWRI